MRFGDEPPEDQPPGFNERPDIIQSAVQYRQERARRAAPQPHQEDRPNGGERPRPEPTITGPELATRPRPQRQYLDDARMLPMKQVVLLQGDGGMGKSLLAVALGLAVSTGSPWIGIAVHAGPVLYLSAEDDIDELTIRQAEIAEAEGIDAAQSFGLEYMVMAGKDAVLAVENGKGTSLSTTPLFARLQVNMEMQRPALLVLDNLADVFAGNENNRSLAKRFVGILHGLAIQHDCVVLLLGHPSLTGLLSGTGMSGSTAWSNSVRSRLYLHKAEGVDEDDLRVLEVMKANYGPTGERIGLKWMEGRFVRQDFASPLDLVTSHDPDRVADLFRTGIYRSDERAADWGGYAIADLLDLNIGRGLDKASRSKEQERDRSNVRKLISLWQANHVFKVEMREDEHRHPKGYFKS